MRKLILFISYLVISNQLLHSDWEQVNAPQIGRVKDVIVDNSDSNIIYAVTHNKIYKTVNSGDNWFIILENDNAGEIFALAPSNQDILYTKEWKSIDGGESWISISPIPNFYWHYGNKIAISPINPDIVFAGDLVNVYQTVDGAQNWSIVGPNIEANKVVYWNNSTEILFALGNYTLYKSIDSGYTWDVVYDNYSIFYGLEINNEILYSTHISAYPFASGEYIVQSSDGGLTWSELSLNSSNYDINGIFDFKITNNSIYATTDKGLYHSNDNGNNWSLISSDYDYLLSFDIESNILVLGSNSNGVSLSSDYGQNWANIGVEPLSSTSSKIISSDIFTTICIGDYSNLFIFDENSQYWRTIMPPSGLGSYNGMAVSFSPQDASKIYCGHSNKLFFSEDNGDTWIFISEMPDNLSKKKISISTDEDKLFLGGYSLIIRSLNAGTSWATKSIPGSYLNDFHYSDNNILYILDNTGYYYSNDNGNIWNNLDNNLPSNGTITSNEIFYHYNNNDILYCLISDGMNGQKIFKKEENNYDWELIYTGQTMISPLIMGKIVTDPNNNVLYASGWDYDTNNQIEYWLFRSLDNGSSWEKCSDNFNFYSNPNYAFSVYAPYKMWYICEDSNFWLGDVQNMTGTGINSTLITLETGISNFPNPFNPSTTISFSIHKKSNVELSIFNIKGQKIKTVINESLDIGGYSVSWNGVDDLGKTVGSGVYLYQIKIPSKILTRKMMLLK